MGRGTGVKGEGGGARPPSYYFIIRALAVRTQHNAVHESEQTLKGSATAISAPR